MNVTEKSNSYIVTGLDKVVHIEEVTVEIPKDFKVRIWGKVLDVVTFTPIVDNGKLLIPFKLGTSEHKLVTAKYFMSTYLKYKL